MDGAQLRDLAAELVRIPSENPLDGPVGGGKGEAALAEFVASYLRDAGVACELRDAVPGRPSVVARLPGAGLPAETLEPQSPSQAEEAGPAEAGEEAIWFDAHLDTVSAAGMESDPYAGRVEGDVLYGRGASDDKASMAAMMAALIRVAQSGVQPPATIIFTATADEEYRMRGLHSLLESGLTARAAIIGEPTGLKVITTHKGVVRFTITTRGKAAHGSDPDAGVNAIYKMARVVQALEAYAKGGGGFDTHPILGKGTLSVGVIRGGEYVNVVPDRCVVDIDRRVLPGEEGRRVVPELRNYLSNALEDIEFEVSPPGLLVPGLDLSGEHPLAVAALAAVKQVTGKASLGGMAGATHAGPLSKAGISALVLGPGAMGQAHTSTEQLDLTQLEQAADIYELLMRTSPP